MSKPSSRPLSESQGERDHEDQETRRTPPGHWIHSSRMRFRKDARLDPSQVEDYRGRGGASRVPGGMPMAFGAAAGSS
jgi:hypothetical protein